MIFGAHTSTTGGVDKAIIRGRELGCDCIQIFVKNNMRWFGTPYSQSELQSWKEESAKHNPQVIFAHAGYLINLASPPEGNREKSIQSLKQELEFCAQLKLPFLVLHPGAHLKQGEEEGIKNVIKALNEVFDSLPSGPRVALEITAGQGTCLGYKLEHLTEIMGKVKKPERLGICLDTAHLFGAGFDIRLPEVWDGVLTKLDELAGLDNLLGIHLNDSKAELGSHVDRHDHIGKGKIGVEAFAYIVNDSRLKKIPGCLETPKSKDFHEDRDNLKILRELVR